MRPFPPEVLHDPIEPGPYRMAMGLTIVPEAAWFEVDALYPTETAEKSRLLTERHADVVALTPGSEAARREALAMVLANLRTHHPDLLTETDADPLEQAARLVQEDMCLIQDAVFTAGVVCFPSRWRLRDKIGKPLAEVHGPVPVYAERLANPVDRFMHHLKPDRIAMRFNWSVLDDPELFQPAGKWRSDRNDAITAENAGDTLFVRVERQTLRLLPVSGAILFGIRVHVYPLWRFAASAARVAAAVRALPEAIARYKSLPSIQAPLLAWLDRQGQAS